VVATRLGRTDLWLSTDVAEEERGHDVANSWDIEGLRVELNRYRGALVADGKLPNTIQTYVDRADRFIRWLAGEYDPSDR
jgi:hypothetical protein